MISGYGVIYIYMGLYLRDSFRFIFYYSDIIVKYMGKLRKL